MTEYTSDLVLIAKRFKSYCLPF